MEEVITYEQMKNRYDGEWVLVDEPETDEAHQVIWGRVVAHSSARDEVYAKMRGLPLRRFALLCFKKVPEGTVIIL